MKGKRKKIFALLLTVSMLVGMMNIVPVQAANQKKTVIKNNTATKIQLDGTGSKETVKVTTKNTNVSTEGSFTRGTKSVSLSINGKNVYSKSFEFYKANYDPDGEPVVELILTDVKTSDKYKDLFLGVYDEVYSGSYKALIRVTYKNGKASVSNLLKTLKSIKSPKINRDRYLSYPEQGYEVNTIESYKGLANGDLIVSGKGSVKWLVCVYAYGGDFLHSYITLTLKSGKLTSPSYPSGVAGPDGGDCIVNDNVAIYKTAGGSKKIITVPKGKTISLPGDFKFVNQKLYTKAVYGGKTGWVDPRKLVSLVITGSDHV